MVKFCEDKESEISLGYFEEVDCVELDKTILYKKHLNNKGVSAVDFILYHTVHEQQQLDFIEVKRSVPVSEDADAIIKKFKHSLQLFIAYGFKRHEYCENLPTLITQLNCTHLLSSEWRFIVICNNKQETPDNHKSQLTALLNKIQTQYNNTAFFKIWNIPQKAIKVLSVEMARKQGLVDFNLPQGTPQ